MADRTSKKLRWGEQFAYFRWHCFRWPGTPCDGYDAWQCHRMWKAGER